MSRFILGALIASMLLMVVSQVSFAGTDIDLTGTYSSFKSTESGDLVGEEIRVLHFDLPEGYWIIYQCAEGEASEPVFVEAKVKGPKALEFTVPQGRSCAGTYTATISSKSLSLKPSLFKKPLMKSLP